MFGRKSRVRTMDEADEAARIIGQLSLHFLLAEGGSSEAAAVLSDGAEDARALLESVGNQPKGSARIRDAVSEGLTRATIGFQAKAFRKDIRRIYGRRSDWRKAIAEYETWVSQNIWSTG